jgi:hypothetical protein
MKKITFSIILIVLFILTACTKDGIIPSDSSLQSYGNDAVLIRGHCGEIFTVAPNGSDDTENLNQTFELAKVAGPKSVVQLTKGTYYINFMVVHDFNGYLRGAGKGKTFVSPIVDLYCHNPAEGMFPPKLVRFIGGDVTISDMTFRLGDVEPCLDSDGWIRLIAILDFADYSTDLHKYLRAEVKNVDLEGCSSWLLPDWRYSWASAIMVGDIFISEMNAPNCHVDLTVTGCNFTKFDIGISYCTVSQGNLKAGDVNAPNTFSNCTFGFGIGNNLKTSVDISYNKVSYLWSAMWFWNNFYPNAGRMWFNVEHNKFYAAANGWPSVIIYDHGNINQPGGDNPMLGKITNNLFSLTEGVWAGIEAWAPKDLVIANNKFTGSGSDGGIFLDGFTDDPNTPFVEETTFAIKALIKGNNFSTLNVPNYDIYLGPQSRYCTVIGGNNKNGIINLGEHNIITGMNVLPHEGHVGHSIKDNYDMIKEYMDKNKGH